MKEKQIKFCPHCESENVSIETSVTDAHDYCVDCGFNLSKNGVVLLVSFPVKIMGEDK